MIKTVSFTRMAQYGRTSNIKSFNFNIKTCYLMEYILALLKTIKIKYNVL